MFNRLFLNPTSGELESNFLHSHIRDVDILGTTLTVGNHISYHLDNRRYMTFVCENDSV